MKKQDKNNSKNSTHLYTKIFELGEENKRLKKEKRVSDIFVFILAVLSMANLVTEYLISIKF